MILISSEIGLCIFSEGTTQDCRKTEHPIMSVKSIEVVDSKSMKHDDICEFGHACRSKK